MSKFAENEKVLPILAPADIVATATNTQYVDLNFAAGIVELALNFGAIASTDSTGEVIVTVTVNPVSDTSSSDNVETAIAFAYRLSAAIATDTMGALAAATATGVAVGQASDNVSLLCFIDPAAVAAAADGARFVRAVITPTAEITSTVVGATARFTPRYAGASIPSST
jgi:hypothetical protein